jgi:hypothetical protein|tara:strand:- start:58 stop:513 length:456 start_codon:yes stop_codon:yes gene_type:complete
MVGHTLKLKGFLLAVIFLVIQGCATPEERALFNAAKTQGLVLHNNLTPTCNSDAWSAYPPNMQNVTVQKIRTEKKQTGQTCTQDITWKDKQNCKNTYRNVNVKYNVTEPRDINWQGRNDFFKFCLANSCSANIDKEDEQYERKTKYCERGR